MVCARTEWQLAEIATLGQALAEFNASGGPKTFGNRGVNLKYGRVYL